MKLFILITFILIVFFKTNTLFSEINLFSVNNIEIEKKDKISNNTLADQAIKKGFNQLIERILIKKDREKLEDLNFDQIKQLITYYRVTNTSAKKKDELLNFNVKFDKDKIHQLFYKRGILYSEVLDKEMYILPINIKENEVFIFNKNFFYTNWNQLNNEGLIEFILPIENIEIIQKVNSNKGNLLNIDLNDLFKEYNKKNLALVLIEDKKNTKRVYMKLKVQDKEISKSLNFEKKNFINDEFNKKIIFEIKEDLINLIKSKNLIDINTPSFLNAKFFFDRDNSLINLNSKFKKIESIENIYIQELNKNYVSLRIKYLGKLEKIINQLKNERVSVQFVNEIWIIKIL